MVSANPYAAQLRAVMNARGVTVRDLTLKVGYTYEYVRQVVAGTLIASPEMHQRISRVLDIDLGATWVELRSHGVRRRNNGRRREP